MTKYQDEVLKTNCKTYSKHIACILIALFGVYGTATQTGHTAPIYDGKK